MGIAFVLLFGFLFSNNQFLFLYADSHQNASNSWIDLTKKRAEVIAFLAQYHDAKTTVYGNVRIVDYFVYDNDTSKFANLRLQIGTDNSHVTFAQIQCAELDDERLEVTNNESVLERHGDQILNVGEVLKDAKCPHTVGGVIDSPTK